MIVAVYGSPRKGGNTEILMDRFLKPIQEKEEVIGIRLAERDIKPCISCGGCNKSGVCVFKDDVWEIYSLLRDARAVVLSSPIYFASVSAQVKGFIDRAQAFWANKFLLHQDNLPTTEKAFFISVGGLKGERYFNNARMIVKTWLYILEIDYAGELFFGGVDGHGEIKQIDDALDKALAAGKSFAD